MHRTVIGITVCDSCNARYRVTERHQRLENKSVRCQRCHQEFTLRIQRPSTIEQAAIENAEEQKQQRRRRTKAQIRQEHLERIKSSFRAFHSRLVHINGDKSSSEEEVRRWCIDVLRDSLDYPDTAIDTELRVLNRRVDIALKHEGKVFLVIECKNIRSKLPKATLDQAVGYAVQLSADWAVTTNGQQWRLYHVTPVRGRDPKVTEIFDVALLDGDGMSDQDAEWLYLLSSRAMLSGDTDRIRHRTSCLSERRLIDAIASERVVRAIRIQLSETYQSDTDERVALEDAHVEDRVRELFLPADL